MPLMFYPTFINTKKITDNTVTTLISKGQWNQRKPRGDLTEHQALLVILISNVSQGKEDEPIRIKESHCCGTMLLVKDYYKDSIPFQAPGTLHQNYRSGKHHILHLENLSKPLTMFYTTRKVDDF